MKFWQSNPYQVRETDLIKLARLAETAALYAYETTQAEITQPEFNAYGSSSTLSGNSRTSFKTCKPEIVYNSPNYSVHLESAKNREKQNTFIDGFLELYKKVCLIDTTEAGDTQIKQQAISFYTDILNSNTGDKAIGEQFRAKLKEITFANASIKHDHYAQYAIYLCTVALIIFFATAMLAALTGPVLYFAPLSLAILPVYALIGELTVLKASAATLMMSYLTAGILECCFGHEPAAHGFDAPFTKLLPNHIIPSAPPGINITDSRGNVSTTCVVTPTAIFYPEDGIDYTHR